MKDSTAMSRMEVRLLEVPVLWPHHSSHYAADMIARSSILKTFVLSDLRVYALPSRR